MAGGNASLEELISDTARGVLVTRFWYIRFVDPQTLLLTGLTRDGTFYIENGQIKHAVKNFRFNESPIIMLNNVDALGRPVAGPGQPDSADADSGLHVHESVGRGVGRLAMGGMGYGCASISPYAYTAE